MEQKGLLKSCSLQILLKIVNLYVILLWFPVPKPSIQQHLSLSQAFVLILCCNMSCSSHSFTLMFFYTVSYSNIVDLHLKICSVNLFYITIQYHGNHMKISVCHCTYCLIQPVSHMKISYFFSVLHVSHLNSLFLPRFFRSGSRTPVHAVDQHSTFSFAQLVYPKPKKKNTSFYGSRLGLKIRL